MDVISSIYKQLFSIKLEHSGYLLNQESSLFRSISVVPDEETGRLFLNHQIQVRFINDSIACFVRGVRVSPPAREPMKLFVPFETGMHIRLIVLAGADFLAKTYVAATGKHSVYYFSNRTDNVQGVERFISKTVIGHSTSTDYDA